VKYDYKVVGNFTDDNFEKILDKILKKFIYMYVDKALFIALKDYNDFEGSAELIDKTFRPVRDFYIEEINEQNVVNQTPIVKDWCLNNLVRLDTQRYEVENQEKLHQVWHAMDNMEAELQKKLEDRKEV